MNCIITKKKTDMNSSGIPLSREGRELLKKIIERHNDKIFQYYKDKNREANDGVDLDDGTLRRFAPKISRRSVIKLLMEEERDIMQTRAEVLGEE